MNRKACRWPGKVSIERAGAIIMRTGSVLGRCKAIVYKEYKEGDVSLCISDRVRRTRIRCGECKDRKTQCSV